MGTVAYIVEPKKCDFCDLEAHYDAKTQLGPWANMCDDHYQIYGIKLGTGWGQLLIVGTRPESDKPDNDFEDYEE